MFIQYSCFLLPNIDILYSSSEDIGALIIVSYQKNGHPKLFIFIINNYYYYDDRANGMTDTIDEIIYIIYFWVICYDNGFFFTIIKVNERKNNIKVVERVDEWYYSRDDMMSVRKGSA